MGGKYALLLHLVFSFFGFLIKAPSPIQNDGAKLICLFFTQPVSKALGGCWVCIGCYMVTAITRYIQSIRKCSTYRQYVSSLISTFHALLTSYCTSLGGINRYGSSYSYY